MFSKYIIAVYLLLDSQVIVAFTYFHKEIDYWKDSVEIKDASPKEKQESFDWNDYLDPKKEEFYREGDHVPPKPFQELVQNPTDENLSKWFKMIDTKNKLMTRLQIRMKEYLAKNKQNLSGQAQAYLRNKAQSIARTGPNVKNYRIQFYFDSQCPHCKRMYPVMHELSTLGYYVEAIQVDKQLANGLQVASRKATSRELKEREINAVPILIIANTQTKTINRLNGFQDSQTLLSILRSGEY